MSKERGIKKEDADSAEKELMDSVRENYCAKKTLLMAAGK